MTQKHIRRSLEEWKSLIGDYRASGLPAKKWCDSHHVSRKSLYNYTRRFNTDIETVSDQTEKHEVVAVDFTAMVNTLSETSYDDGHTDPAVRLIFPGFSVEIRNSAASEMIRNTIAALQQIC